MRRSFGLPRLHISRPLALLQYIAVEQRPILKPVVLRQANENISSPPKPPSSPYRGAI
ncbi:hypothetical protein TIFTF001_006944 [Ficus carica]|uniref:Uncharacterized protein n=1 Tax=Ficus carica TaxID=3494 RepID=A0AA88CWI8_FICCA|nr:hypothetical protein TIFTF001_006944 [Ficus carica]